MDANVDGLLDAAVANDGTNLISVLLGNGDGTCNASQSSPVGVVGPSQVVAGDLNGDRSGRFWGHASDVDRDGPHTSRLYYLPDPGNWVYVCTIRPPQERAIPGARYVETASGYFMPHQTPELFLETVLPLLQGA